jgi:hypothetical protein
VGKKAFKSFGVLAAILIFLVPSSYAYYETLIETDVFFPPGDKWDDPDEVPPSFLDKQSHAEMIFIPFLLPFFLEEGLFAFSCIFSLPSCLLYPTSLVLRC